MVPAVTRFQCSVEPASGDRLCHRTRRTQTVNSTFVPARFGKSRYRCQCGVVRAQLANSGFSPTGFRAPLSNCSFQARTRLLFASKKRHNATAEPQRSPCHPRNGSEQFGQASKPANRWVTSAGHPPLTSPSARSPRQFPNIQVPEIQLTAMML